MTATLIQPPAYRSLEWRTWRRAGLGASDLPSVVGCPDAYLTEYQLQAQKLATETAEDDPSDVMRLGSFLEPYALMRWEESTGLHLLTGETWVDPRWPNLWATLDGREPERRIGVEAKYQSRGSIDGDLPERFVVQALAQIGLADLAAVDVVRLDARGGITVARVERDEARVTALLDLAQAWYRRHVIEAVPVPLDGSPEARRALDRMVGSEQREADERQRDLLADLRRTRVALERLQAAEESLVRDIKASMAGAGVLVAPALARVTWSPVKGRRTTDWKAVAADAGADPALIERHTRQGDPTTRFAVDWEDEA